MAAAEAEEEAAAGKKAGSKKGKAAAKEVLSLFMHDLCWPYIVWNLSYKIWAACRSCSRGHEFHHIL